MHMRKFTTAVWILKVKEENKHSFLNCTSEEQKIIMDMRSIKRKQMRQLKPSWAFHTQVLRYKWRLTTSILEFVKLGFLLCKENCNLIYQRVLVHICEQVVKLCRSSSTLITGSKSVAPYFPTRKQNHDWKTCTRWYSKEHVWNTGRSVQEGCLTWLVGRNHVRVGWMSTK